MCLLQRETTFYNRDYLMECLMNKRKKNDYEVEKEVVINDGTGHGDFFGTAGAGE